MEYSDALLKDVGYVLQELISNDLFASHHITSYYTQSIFFFLSLASFSSYRISPNLSAR
jgi:hypothetical protein